ncbi:MBL fold metallo-hydrolase [Actinospica sp. MGRD01-02]|uniref:MBL fold metallo-hydrolase n=1 Tax=Actinospica acidithermotolerans TaxID=2828514 RepID=A0A941IIX3_9ACTN|nr:MBL fold metallo-hydrolase [Actinospica acidithermotolerans]MBR7828794.1 MBL fold metallo-hydrolase [Actinospica acidithermotolerans]
MTATGLDYEVLVSPAIPLAMPDRTPDGGARTWAPVSTTLVYGRREAVLIDPPLTAAQAERVADRVEAAGRRLTYIFATHAHGDHWFTAASLADRFPGARVVATAGTIEQMRRAVQARAGFWDRIVPDQIPASPVTATATEEIGNRLGLEGHELPIIEVGHSDTDDTSVLHVPDLGLVVAGDVVYNGVHQYLVESGDGGRDAWRGAIDVVEALGAGRLVAGHKNGELDDDAARQIEQTRRYLADVDEVLMTEPTPEGFYHAMIRRHPDHLNRSSLWGSSQALYAGRR